MLRLILGVLIGAVLGWLARQYMEEQESGWPAPAEPTISIRPDAPAEADEPAAEPGATTVAYCARCRTKRPMSDPEPTTTKTGRRAMRGVCPVCGASMFRFVSPA